MTPAGPLYRTSLCASSVTRRALCAQVMSDDDSLFIAQRIHETNDIARQLENVVGGNWLWSVGLVVTKVPRGELITTGPYALVKHPIYTSVSFLVLPAVGLLFNTWLGVLVGIVLYISSRIYAPEEEAGLAKTFGPAWDEYGRKVKVSWL